MLLKKKLAVLGLAAVMTVAFMPAMAFADETSTTTEGSAVQEVSSTAIPNNGELTGSTTYKLDDALTQSLTVKSSANVTLDLNGKTLTNTTEKDTIKVEKGGTLTIVDTSTGEKGTIDNVSHGKAAVFNNGTVTIKGGVNVTRSKETGKNPSEGGKNTFYNIVNHGIMTIDDASVKQTGGFSSMIENGYYSYSSSDPSNGYVNGTNEANPTLTINGGKFSGGINTVKNDDGGKLVINGGTFKNNTQSAVLNWNDTTINGGTFDNAKNVTTGVITTDGDSSDSHDAGKLTINGGIYSGTHLFSDMSGNGGEEKGTISVKAGDYTGITDSLSTSTAYSTEKFISGGTYKALPTANLQDNVAQATVTNGTSTTYAVGDATIKEAAQDPENTVEITQGSIALKGANATIKNASTNNGTVTVDGETLNAGSSKQVGAAQTITNLKKQIADLQAQIQTAASQGSTASANITSLKSDLAKAKADLKEAQKQVNEGKSTLTAPAQVMDLKVKAGKRNVKLTWTALTENTTGYRIYRKAKGGKYARVKTITKATQGSWTNKGLKKGKTYYFKVRAYKSITSGELWGAYSNTAKAKVK